MALYRYLRKAWLEPAKENSDIVKQRLIAWRKEPVTLRIERPTRLDRARSLGYRAKQGIIIVRQKVTRGGHRKPFPSGGRRSKKWTTRKSLNTNYQTIAEQRAAAAYENMEVLNSYEVGRDGHQLWYEIIMIDYSHPAIKADPALSWITKPVNRGRPFRGLTSSAKRSRGLMHRGKGAEKLRPSRYANKKRRINKKKMPNVK